MHCPSCVETITQLLEPLPTVANLNISLLLHTITFTPNSSAAGTSAGGKSQEKTVAQVTNILRREGGFKVESDLDKGKSRTSLPSPKTNSDGLVARIWTTLSPKQALERKREENRRRIHLDNCEACREGRDHDDQDSQAPLSDSSASSADADSTVVRTTLAIDGMTCASCTQSITSAVSSNPDVVSVEINLLGHSGVVTHKVSLTSEQVKDEVEDCGFTAEVISSTPVKEDGEDTESMTRTVFSIEGMTCASCSGAITKQLQGLALVKDVNVDLLNNRGTIVHTADITPEEIKENIEDIGYGAEIISTAPVNAPRQASAAKRTVRVRIAGIFCGECIKKLNRHLSSLDLRFTPLSKDEHATSITYTPREPYTIRDILSSLSDVSPEFEASVMKEVSLSDRSKDIQRREVKILALHWLVAFIVTIPTFIM